MKRMKNPSLWRVPLAMALVMLLLLASALPTWAAEDGEMTRFTADAAGTTITADFPDGSSKTYYRYESTSASPLQCHPYSGFGYTATLTVGGTEYNIASPEEAGEVLYLYVMDENRRVVQSVLYLSEEGRAAAEAIGAEEADIVTMLARKGTLPATAAVQYNKNLQEALGLLEKDTDAERATFSTEELRYAPVYAVMNIDDDRWLGRVTGHIYDLHGAYYYIPLASIPAGYLQADGWIADVPGGSLTLIRVEEGSELCELIEDVIPSTVRHYSFTDESYTWNGLSRHPRRRMAPMRGGATGNDGGVYVNANARIPGPSLTKEAARGLFVR